MAAQLEATFEPNITVGRVEEDVDKAVLNAVFRAKKPSPGKSRLGSTVTTEGNYAVYALNAVIPGRPEAIPLEERDQRKERLQSEAGAADYIAFVNDLTRKADVERNADILVEQDFLE